MTTKIWKDTTRVASSTSDWLRHAFKWGRADDIRDYQIGCLKKDGGIHTTLLSALSDAPCLIEGLTEMPPFAYRQHYNKSFQSGSVTTEQVIATYARLAIMGFDSTAFNLLKEAFPEVIKRMTKPGAVVPHMLLNALWYDTLAKRGDCFHFPLDDRYQPAGTMTINEAGTHGMFEGIDSDGDGVLVFAPLNVTPKQLEILTRHIGCPSAARAFEWEKVKAKVRAKGGQS